jgi:predicted site-specific integrase-resolvase
MTSDKLIPLTAAAKRLGVNPKTMRRYIEYRYITAVNLSTGKRPTYSIAESEIEIFLEKRKTGRY